MSRYELTHLTDPALVRDTTAIIARQCIDTADLLAHLGEIDARKLYVRAAYPSMYLFCVQELKLCEQAALKRIRAARVAREYPAIFPMVADGWLQLSGIVLLSSYLKPENAEELLAAAASKTVAETELLLAERFPRYEQGLEMEVPVVQLSSRRVEVDASPAQGLSSRRVERPDAVGRMTPMAPGLCRVEVVLDQQMQADLRYAQSLMGHSEGSGERNRVFGRALRALVETLEKRKFGTGRKVSARTSTNPRQIPKNVRREVFLRDYGQCTFHSDEGKRCPATGGLELDHIEPVACGGRATVENLRLRCRAHNQYEAERTFGARFMEEKRDAAREGRNGRNKQSARSTEPAGVPLADSQAEVIPYLRQLGLRVGDAHDAAAQCDPGASLEDRVRAALKYYGRRRFSRALEHSAA